MPYIGELAHIPAGEGTLVSDNNKASLRHTDLVEAEGIVSSGGSWTREPGATPYYATGLNLGFDFSGTTSSYSHTVPAGNFQWVALGASFKLLGTPSLERVLDPDGYTERAGGTTLDLYVSGTATPSGSTIVVCVATSASANVLSVVDDAGNTYALAVKRTGGGAPACAGEIWYAMSALPLAPGQKVRVTLGTSQRGYANALVFQGLAVTGALDLTVSGEGVAAADDSAASFVATSGSQRAQGTEVLVGFELQRYERATTFSLASGWTLAASAQFTFTGVFFYDSMSTALAYRVISPASENKKVNVMLDYWPTESAQRLLALGSDGVLYKSSGAEFSAITMALTMGNQPGSLLVVGGQEKAGSPRKVFCFDNGATRMQVLSGDGTSTTTFGSNWNTTTNIPLDWASNPPRGGITHKGRLWCYSPTNAPHCVYASQLKDHENFKNAVGGSLEYVETIGEGTGINIAAAASFKGMLFLFKYPRGVYYLDDTDVDYLNWRWNIVTDAVGVANSPYAVIVTDDDVIFFDPNGHAHFLSAITQQGVATGDASSRLNLVDWAEENVNLSRLNWMSSVWYPAKQMAIVGVSPIGSTTNGLRIFLDFSTSSDDNILRVSYSKRDVNRALAIRRDSDGVQRPIMSEEDGVIWKMDQKSKEKVGYPNAGRARYRYVDSDFRHIDASLANKMKIFDALTICFEPKGRWPLSVDTWIDGKYHETVYYDMGASRLIFGHSIFGVDHFGSSTLATVRKRITGAGYRMSLGGHIDEGSRDFDVHDHIINFRVGGEEQRGTN